MPSYVVTGASRGLGFQFLKTLSANPQNIVIGLARNKSSLENNLSKANLPNKNITIFEGDVGDLSSLKKAAKATSEITGGDLDVLINNAAFITDVSEFKTLADFDDEPEVMDEDFLKSFRVNTLGLIHVVMVFLPLIQKGSVKKVINISSGMADINVVNSVEVGEATPYAATKAASNLVIAKYNATYKKEGILFLSISPGYVATERNAEAASNDPQKRMELGMKFQKYAPHFTGPLSPEESIEAVLGVIDKSTLEKGDGGAFLSHLGNQQWL